MLRRVLGVAPVDLGEAEFDRLIDEGVAEHQRLEFKSALPGQTPDDRREFARDVAAMANGGGGLIVFGIEEGENDTAGAITPVELGDQVTRLNQIANSLIEPYLQLTMHTSEVDDGPTGLIVVEVPVSQRRPFAVVEGSRLGYYLRTGRSRHALAEAEVAQMYQSRSVRLRSVETRATALKVDAARRLGPGHPALVMVVVPFDSFERLFRPDRATEDEVRALTGQPVFGAPVGRVFPQYTKPGFKRIEMSQRFANLAQFGWMEFHDDGAFVAVIAEDPRLTRPHDDVFFEGPPAEEIAGGFYDSVLTAQLIASLLAYGTLAENFDVHGELLVRATFVEEGLPAILSTDPTRGEVNGARALDHEVSTELSAAATDFVELTALLQVASPLLDDLMSAFGWPRNFQLHRDGTIRLSFFSREWRPAVDQWAEQIGLAVTDDQAD